MADEPQKPEAPAQAPVPPINVTVVQAAPEPVRPAAPTQGMDLGVEGGAYMIDGQLVNAEGEPIGSTKRGH